MNEELSEEGGGGGAMSLAPRLYKAKLEDAITAKQEFEAKAETMDAKLKQQETEISNLRLRVISFGFCLLFNSLNNFCNVVALMYSCYDPLTTPLT